MKRERGIALLRRVLTAAASASIRPLTMLDEIHVFGSFARGALSHDIDAAADTETSRERQHPRLELAYVSDPEPS